MAIVVLFVVLVTVMPAVSEALVAIVARFVEFVPVVLGLAAIGSVAVDIVMQPIFPFVDVPAAARDVIVVGVRDPRGTEE
ncbi:MAG TPA: hypothetical protein VNY09_04005 [Candidatus Sulfotelmatobacter sp.]|nr:hypothetical protein [Candidatus Sulfotelmatobacter sp.]